MLLRYTIIFTNLTVFCLKLVTSECTNEMYGLYCKDTGKDETQPVILVPNNKDTSTIPSIYLNNATGVIINDTFASFPKLIHLDIQFSTIKIFKTNLIFLESFYLIKNVGFPDLTNNFFKTCCPNLRMIIVEDNLGLNILEGAFNNTNISHLTINDQNLTHLTIGHLKGLYELVYLNLKYNGIKKIDGNAFEDLKNLNNLILSNNNISSFEENTFKNLTNLENLELLNLNISSINKTIFKSQRELRHIGISTKMIKGKLTLQHLTTVFRNLESIGLQKKDENDSDVNSFIEICKYSGFRTILIL